MSEPISAVKYRTFSIPRHPDDDHIPDSIINIYLSPGRIVTIQGPLFSKTMGMLSECLEIWKPAMTVMDAEEDYQI